MGGGSWTAITGEAARTSACHGRDNAVGTYPTYTVIPRIGDVYDASLVHRNPSWEVQLSVGGRAAIASVMGREFHLAPLVRMSEDPSGVCVLAALEEALTAHVIEEVPGSVEGYQFAHSLIQETLAGELLAARRVRLGGDIWDSY